MSVSTATPAVSRTRPSTRTPSASPGPRNDAPDVRFALSYDALKMKGTPARRVISRSARAVSMACASLSMTQGPAMSTRLPAPMLTPPASTGTTRLPHHRGRGGVGVRALVAAAGLDEPGKQRVRLQRLRLELRVELHRDVPRVRWQLDDLDELAVERAPHDFEPLLGQRLLVEAVELVAMAVALVDDVAAIEGVRLRPRFQLALVRPEPHRPAEIVHAEQIAQLVDHVGLRLGRALGRVGLGQPAHVPRVLDRGPLEAVADAEVGNAALARDLRGAHHAARAAIAEAAGHEDAVGAVEQLLAPRLLERLRFHPADVHLQPVLEATMVERFVQALVGVLVADVLADDVDGDLLGGVPDAIDQVDPLVHLRFGLGQVEPLQNDAVEPFFGEDRRHLVDARHVARGDHRLFVHVAEERDLALDLLVEMAVGSAQQDVGLDADGAQIAHAVLRRLGLQLAGRADERHQREVDVERVVAPDVLAQLPDGLDERQALDGADRAADLDQDDVHVCGDGLDRVLDRVGDVRDDLHRAPEVVAAALLLDHLQVDLAGGPVVVARGDGVGEALVVPEIEIGLGAVVGDVDLAVLVGAHRARVDVDVGVELLQGDGVAVPFEQS